MFVLDSYSIAVVLCIVTMLCWGSWANTLNLAGDKWRFELFYWDYSLGVLLLSLLFAFTLGSNGVDGRGFLEDAAQADLSNIGNALIGGVVFNLANILLVAAISIAGMAVAFPVGIGIALVLGVVVNYMAEPVGNAAILFLGVGFVMCAILLDAIAYKRLKPDSGSASTRGLVIAIISGLLMGSFYRFVASSMSPDFMNLEPGKLSPYTAVVFFSVGVFASSFVLNTFFMKKPLIGEPVTFSQYFAGSMKLHVIGVIGGLIWGLGMSLNILASGQAGFAISYGLGQGATMVAAFWGVFIWKEFQGAPQGTNTLISLMFLCFIVGLFLIVYARLV